MKTGNRGDVLNCVRPHLSTSYSAVAHTGDNKRVLWNFSVLVDFTKFIIRFAHMVGVCMIPRKTSSRDHDFPGGFSRQRNQTPDSRAKTVVRTCPPQKKKAVNTRQGWV